MSLVRAKGNMYLWVTYMHTHLGGECPHKCLYCYVGTSRWGRPVKYTGDIRLIESELKVDYGKDKTIFIEHMNDGFAEKIPQEFIEAILSHCRKYPDNTYVFQTKNPLRMLSLKNKFPPHIILGTTIETSLDTSNISKAPIPLERYIAFKSVLNILKPKQSFVTIEPIIRFDLPRLVLWLLDLQPNFINIGADSKHCHLPEPTSEKVQNLIRALREQNMNIKVKDNLQRLLNG